MYPYRPTDYISPGASAAARTLGLLDLQAFLPYSPTASYFSTGGYQGATGTGANVQDNAHRRTRPGTSTARTSTSTSRKHGTSGQKRAAEADLSRPAQSAPKRTKLTEPEQTGKNPSSSSHGERTPSQNVQDRSRSSHRSSNGTHRPVAASGQPSKASQHTRPPPALNAQPVKGKDIPHTTVQVASVRKDTKHSPSPASASAPVVSSKSTSDRPTSPSSPPVGPPAAMPAPATVPAPASPLASSSALASSVPTTSAPASTSAHVNPCSESSSQMSTPGDGMATSAAPDCGPAPSAAPSSVSDVSANGATVAPLGSGSIPSLSAPAPAERIFPPMDARSAELWYPDGNVIVKVEGAYFQLFRSRLERHCEYFKRVFEDGEGTIVEGQAIVEVNDIKLQDFEALLRYLEIPAEHSVKDTSTEVAISLLRAARVLGCTLVRELAEKRVFGPWSTVAPPADSDDLADRPYDEGIKMLSLARELELPHVRKQALYALLASDTFWSDVGDPERCVAVDLPDSDLVLLYRARVVMQENWRRQYLSPPKACLTEGCCDGRDANARRIKWHGEFAAATVEEARDPLRAADRMQQYVHTLTGWCQSCIEDRANAWQDVRAVWWAELDRLLASRY